MYGRGKLGKLRLANIERTGAHGACRAAMALAAGEVDVDRYCAGVISDGSIVTPIVFLVAAVQVPPAVAQAPDETVCGRRDYAARPAVELSLGRERAVSSISVDSHRCIGKPPLVTFGIWQVSQALT